MTCSDRPECETSTIPLDDSLPWRCGCCGVGNGPWSGKSKRRKENAMGEPTVQASVIVDQLIHHPRCGRTAYNQDDVVSGGCPTVPKVFKRRDKLRPLGVHPWKFVNEYDLARLVDGIEIRDEHLEGIYPVGGHGCDTLVVSAECVEEALQLFLSACIGHPRTLEHHFLLKKLPDQECLANSSSAAYRNKFRMVGIVDA